MFMAGMLWKWTNYFNGWQERWFILDNGILSYYKSEEDVNTGCKGSVKMSVCDIVVHATDATRLDLIIPGEQHFYVRASNSQERQQWLVALGSAKASLGKIHEEKECTSPDLLKSKRSELRLYCDLLMQQIHSVKMTIQENDVPDIEKLNEVTSLISPTCDTFIRTLEECMTVVQTTSMPFEGQHPLITDATLPTSPHKHSNKKGRQATRQNSNERGSISQLSRSPSISSADSHSILSRQNSRNRSTSDTSMSNTDHSYTDHTKHEHSRLLDTVTQSLNNHSNKLHLQNQGHVQYNPSKDHHSKDSNSKTGQKDQKVSNSSSNENGSLTNSHSPGVESVNNYRRTSQSNLSINSEENGDFKNCENETDELLQNEADVFLDPIETKVPTFFSLMKPSFLDVRLHEDGGIPVEPFLDACRGIVPFFDKLSATALAPVKMDFQGNIRKVRTKYSLHPEQFTTLQSIILHEKGVKQHHLPNSATMALLWMKRSLEFISGFLEEIKNGEQNLGTACSNAYIRSLKPYHGWVVRGVFAVVVKALPYRDVFISLLNPNTAGTVDPQVFTVCLMQDIDSCCTAIGVIVKILHDFYIMHNINMNEQI